MDCLKNIRTVLLNLLIISLSLMTFMDYSYGNDNPQFLIDYNISASENGDLLTISIYGDVSSLNSFRSSISYPEDKVEYISAEKGSNLSSNCVLSIYDEISDTNMDKVFFVENPPVGQSEYGSLGSGSIICTLQFRILENTKESFEIVFHGKGDAKYQGRRAPITVNLGYTTSGTVSDTISLDDLKGTFDDVETTVNVSTENSKDQFSCDSYADATGKYLVKYTGTVADGNVVKYTSGSTVTDLYYSEKYGAWVFLADSDLSLDLTNANFSVVSGDITRATIKYNGDVNKNGTTNIVDAQIAYDIANNVYPTFEALPMEMWLSADVNTEFGVAAGDARAIQCIIHGIQDDSVSV